MDVRGKKRTPQLFNPVHCLAHPHSNHRPSLRLRYRDASLEFHVCGLWIWAGNRKHGQAAVAPSALFSWNNWSYNWFLEHHKEIMGFFFLFYFFSIFLFFGPAGLSMEWNAIPVQPPQPSWYQYQPLWPPICWNLHAFTLDIWGSFL